MSQSLGDSISVQALKSAMSRGESFFILDVREPWEYEQANLGGHLIPLKELESRLDELDPLQPIVVHCQHGVRGGKAVHLLQSKGFPNVKNLVGGLAAWHEDPK